jgi:hypothetical protein
VVESVYYAVRTDSLYKADYVSSLKGLNEPLQSIQLRNFLTSAHLGNQKLFKKPPYYGMSQYDESLLQDKRFKILDFIQHSQSRNTILYESLSGSNIFILLWTSLFS